ncbi:MAG: nucleoside-diphosphate kinase [candidate division WOR-3 bacterium]
MEETLLLIKPDAIQRKLVGKIITRVEEEGFEILDMKMVYLPRKDAEEFYIQHKGEYFYERLINYMGDNKIIALRLKGKNGISRLRELIGETDPKLAKKNTIRGDYGLGVPQNSVHASDSPQSAKREIDFFFKTPLGI